MKTQLPDLKKHPALMLHSDIAAICKPMFDQFAYSIMNFIRVYEDGSVLYLCDNKAWLQHYLKNGYPAIGAFEQNPMFHDQGHVLWDALNDNDPVVIFSRKMFNIRYGVTLIKKFAGGHDFFNFGTSKESRSLLINQLEELEKFPQIFYSKAQRLLNSSANNVFSLQDFKSQPEPAVEVERLYLGPAYDYDYLTNKELVCMKALSLGMTIPEMAILHAVSPRTIEKHIERIKSKLHCRTQCELGYLIAKLGIDEISPL